MINSASGDQCWDLTQLLQPHDRVLRIMKFRRFLKTTPLCHERMQEVILYRRVRSDLSQIQHVPGSVSGFLEQFARRRLNRLFSFIDHSTRNLQCALACAVTMLFNEYNITILGYRYDVDPVGRLKHIEVMRSLVPGVDAHILAQIEDA